MDAMQSRKGRSFILLKNNLSSRVRLANFSARQPAKGFSKAQTHFCENTKSQLLLGFCICGRK